MALCLSISSSHGPASSPAISTCRPASCGRFPALVGSSVPSQKRSLIVMTGSEMRGVTPVRSSGLETTLVGAEAVTGQVTEVTKDTFWPIVKAAGEKVVVLNMYTQWCAPCKIMAPKFQELSEKDLDAVFLKLDCNQDTKALAKELGIKVVPTFKVLKDGKVVKEVTGAKIDELSHAIKTVKSSRKMPLARGTLIGLRPCDRLQLSLPSVTYCSVLFKGELIAVNRRHHIATLLPCAG